MVFATKGSETANMPSKALLEGTDWDSQSKSDTNRVLNKLKTNSQDWLR